MNLLNAILYDPATVATHNTTALLAMTAFDTTNLRLNVVVPSHGFVRFRIAFQITGATTFPQVHAGVMNGSTVVARVTPVCVVNGTAVATTRMACVADFVVGGLTPGSTNFDAAYGVDLVIASTSIKYGGPDNTTATDAYGAFVFEAYDPQPNPTNFGLLSIDSNGRVDVIKIAGTTQTARDIGASVLLSPGTGTGQVNLSSGLVPIQAGTGTGQLDFTSGVVKANVTQYGGSAGTFSGGRPEVNTTHWKGTTAATVDTAGYPVVTIKSGAGAGEIDLSTGKVRVSQIANNAITASTIATDAIGAAQLAADAVAEIQSGLATSAALATAQTSIDDLPTNAELATALGTADDATLAAIAAEAVKTAAIKAKTDNLPSDPADASDIAALIAGVSNPTSLQTTTIASLTSQLVWTLTAGSADNKAYNGCLAVITDASTAVQKAVAPVLQYVGASKTVRLAYDPGVFTMATTDNVSIVAANLTPVVQCEMSVKSTAGSAAQLSVWMEVEGTKVPVASIDASATCSVVVYEHDSGVALFTASGVAGDITNSIFQYEQASPGFTDDRQYQLIASVTLNSQTYTTTHNRVVIG